MSYDSSACQKRVCGTVVVDDRPIFLTLPQSFFQNSICYSPRLPLFLRESCQTNRWEDGVRDFIFWKHHRVWQIRFMYPWWRRPDTDPNCPLPWLMLTDWPQQHQQVRQINEKMKAAFRNVPNLSCVCSLTPQTCSFVYSHSCPLRPSTCCAVKGCSALQKSIRFPPLLYSSLACVLQHWSFPFCSPKPHLSLSNSACIPFDISHMAPFFARSPAFCGRCTAGKEMGRQTRGGRTASWTHRFNEIFAMDIIKRVP